MGRIKIIAHRGSLSEETRGNTMEDFKKSAEAGVEMIELDIRRTKDNVFIAHYEADISGIFLSGISYKTAQDISKNKGYDIPRLEDVIGELPEMQFDFELKEEGYEAEFVEFLHTYLPDNSRYIISSFNDRTITLLKNKDPNIQAGLRLYEKKPKENEFFETRIAEVFPFKRIDECNADFISLNWKLLPTGLLWRAEKRGIPVHVSCVDSKTNLKPFLKNPTLKGILTSNFHEVRKLVEDLEK
ncbi:MAG: glycerophosphodiester phosphodiesterase [Candidatus Undinarchaeales archaeon]|jgi:glycerophosphoryl diester phosphodiesterase|nr:glycerophosphodiester phosphodiesterase [Candidatus Undinarchaeales archaeon]